MKTKRYDELAVGDVIIFHGAKERVTEVSHHNWENKYYPGEVTVRFELEPYDEEAVKILGGFYSHGGYGGVGCLITEVFEEA